MSRLSAHTLDGNPSVKSKKPYRLRKWKLAPPQDAVFFTCARPGRSARSTSRDAQVPDDEVSRWVLGLPSPKTAIISLLGEKPDGSSEFRFYSFGSALGPNSDGSETFSDWLGRVHSDLGIIVCEHPTTDFNPVEAAILDAASESLRRLASKGHTVVVVDSGGEQRTRQLCRHLGASETFSV